MAILELSVYQKRMAGVVNGKYDKKTSVVLRKRMTLTEDYAKALNQGYTHSGIYYQLDKKATEQFKKDKKK